MDRHGPFQTYDDTSDAATCAPRLAAWMRRRFLSSCRQSVTTCLRGCVIHLAPAQCAGL